MPQNSIFTGNVLATIRALSLGMKIIPKTESSKWKKVFFFFTNLKILEKEWTIKCSTLSKTLQQLLFVIKIFRSTVPGAVWRNTNMTLDFVAAFEIGSTIYFKALSEWRDSRICPTRNKQLWEYCIASKKC